MKCVSCLVLFGIAIAATGCQSKSVSGTAANGRPIASAFLLATEPAGAVPVGKARGKSEDGQQVIVVGRIGGSNEPFVDGLAAFTIVDPKVPHCATDEGCPTPWDYCCEIDAVKDNIATVKIVDEAGRPVAENARDLLNVKELSMVVVQGTANRDDRGNLTVAANQVFVRPGE